MGSGIVVFCSVFMVVVVGAVAESDSTDSVPWDAPYDDGLDGVYFDSFETRLCVLHPGLREYSARVMNITMRSLWAAGCASASGTLNGELFVAPELCKLGGTGMWGYVHREDETCRPHWSDIRGQCSSYRDGIKEYRSQLMDADRYEHWEKWCERWAVTVNHVTLLRPTWCKFEITGEFGYMETPSGCCRSKPLCSSWDRGTPDEAQEHYFSCCKDGAENHDFRPPGAPLTSAEAVRTFVTPDKWEVDDYFLAYLRYANFEVKLSVSLKSKLKSVYAVGTALHDKYGILIFDDSTPTVSGNSVIFRTDTGAVDPTSYFMVSAMVVPSTSAYDDLFGVRRMEQRRTSAARILPATYSGEVNTGWVTHTLTQGDTDQFLILSHEVQEGAVFTIGVKRLTDTSGRRGIKLCMAHVTTTTELPPSTVFGGTLGFADSYNRNSRSGFLFDGETLDPGKIYNFSVDMILSNRLYPTFKASSGVKHNMKVIGVVTGDQAWFVIQVVAASGNENVASRLVYVDALQW